MTTTSSIKVESNPSTDIIPCFNPASGEKLGDIAACTAEDVPTVIASSKTAQLAWGKSSFKQRRAVLGHMLDHILEHADELVDVIVQVSGKTHENALLGEIMTVCNKLRWLMKYGEKHLQPESVPSGILLHKKGRIEYRPLGVVACIVPWNYPFQNIFGSLTAPLMAGNSVIIKASEAVAWSTQRFQSILDDALSKEGFSSDTVQIINGYGDTGAALVRGGVQKILFIGSVPNGRRIIEGSAEHLTPTVMELGGKDAFIVCDDAKLDLAVHSALGGCFINLGQNCVASERIIVHSAIYARFVAEVSKHAAAFRQGTPLQAGQLDAGAITSPVQVKVIDELVSDAIANGAKALVGGQLPDQSQGNTYPPTVLVNVSPTMRISQEEVFGPVMLIMRVSSDKEAITLANSTHFGLHSSIFSQNRKRAEHIASQLQVGASCINDFGMCYLNQDLPFGGVKYSGFGRMNGRDGLRAYSNAKAVLTDRFWFQIPPKLYPVKPGDYEKARSSIRLLFAPRWRDKFAALGNLIRQTLRGAA